MPTHSILGGKVKLYRRDDGGDHWFCSAYFQGKNRRKTTKTDSLPHAEEIAEGWYLELRGKGRAGLLDRPAEGKPFKTAADIFLDEYKASVSGERSERWIKEHEAHLENHLKPYFGKYTVPEIDADKAQEYRLHRIKTALEAKAAARKKKIAELVAAEKHEEAAKLEAQKDAPPARNTIENEIITLRMVLKMSVRKGWLKGLPDLSAPYRKQKKVEARPWFTPEEYKRLYLATRAYSQSPLRERFRWDAEQLHDLVLFLGNTGLRPDEAKNLEHRDVEMVKDEATGELILEIEIRGGKVGFGNCKSRPDAVKPYQRLLNRPKWTPQGRKPRSKKAMASAANAELPAPQRPQPTDKVFPGNHIKLFNKILGQNGLKYDRDGKRHTLYSLRHTYICMRLSEGADIYQLAKNCRTSVEMIEKHYASHIKGVLDAAAINTTKLRRKPRTQERRD